MNKKLIALAGATVATFAFADGMDAAYVGMGIGGSTLTNSSGGVAQPGLGLYAGYDIADWVQLEGTFTSASFNVGKSRTVTDADEISRVYSNPASINTLAVTGKFDWWWVDSFGIYAKIGLGMQYNNYGVNSYPVGSPKNPNATSANGFEPAILGGLGLQWNIGKVGLRVEDMYQVSSHDNQAMANGLGSNNTYAFIVQYHF